MTAAQKRLIDVIRAYGGDSEEANCAEYWPVVNDWVKDSGPAAALAFRNQERTVAALIRDGYVTIEDGLFRLTERAKSAGRPVRAELPKARAQGFDRLFKKLEEAFAK